MADLENQELLVPGVLVPGVVVSTSLGLRPWAKRDPVAACVALATGAHGGVSPGLLPSVAVSDLD